MKYKFLRPITDKSSKNQTMLLTYRFPDVRTTVLLMWFQFIFEVPKVAYYLEEELLQVLRQKICCTLIPSAYITSLNIN
jgi:hypothetical protein